MPSNGHAGRKNFREGGGRNALLLQDYGGLRRELRGWGARVAIFGFEVRWRGLRNEEMLRGEIAVRFLHRRSFCEYSFLLVVEGVVVKRKLGLDGERFQILGRHVRTR